MANLGDMQYYKLSVNGQDVYEAMPWYGNVPYGYTPLTKEQYIAGIKDQIKQLNDVKEQYNWKILGPDSMIGTHKETGQNFIGQTPSQSNFDRLQKQLNAVLSGQEQKDPNLAKFQLNAPTPSEQYYTKEYKASLPPSEQARLNKLYNQNDPISPAPAGMKEVAIGGGFGYVPVSSEVNQPQQNKAAWVTGPGGVPTKDSPADQLADYVMKNGLQDIQNLPWWRDNKNKQAAWAIIQGGKPVEGAAAGGAQGAAQGGAQGAQPAQGNQPAQGAQPAKGAAGSPESIASAMAVLNKYMNNGELDSGTYQFFKKAIENWDPANDVDYANILNTFETIKNEDINPYFQEQANIFIDSVQNSLQQTKSARDIELAQEAQDTRLNIQNTQQDLANRGMLFSGEAVKKLGTESAFAQTGSEQAGASAIPTVDFAGLPIGEVQQVNKAATSTSALRYQNQLKDLQRQAELALGSTGSAGLVPEVKQLGGVTGTQVNAQKSAQASALTGLYNQEMTNYQAAKPIDMIKS